MTCNHLMVFLWINVTTQHFSNENQSNHFYEIINHDRFIYMYRYKSWLYSIAASFNIFTRNKKRNFVSLKEVLFQFKSTIWRSRLIFIWCYGKNETKVLKLRNRDKLIENYTYLFACIIWFSQVSSAWHYLRLIFL